MSQLKKLSKGAIPGALEKAERYRFLNEATEAESICLDVLNEEPNNQKALVILLLSLTDQFAHGYSAGEAKAKDVLGKLNGEYERKYYEGIIAERLGKAKLHESGMGSGALAFDYLQRAMVCYEEAEKIRPPGNDDALLRWNTCVRLISRNKLTAQTQEQYEHQLE